MFVRAYVYMSTSERGLICPWEQVCILVQPSALLIFLLYRTSEKGPNACPSCTPEFSWPLFPDTSLLLLCQKIDCVFKYIVTEASR